MLFVVIITCCIRPVALTVSQEGSKGECTLGDKECRKTEKPKLRLDLPYINAVKVRFRKLALLL